MPYRKGQPKYVKFHGRKLLNQQPGESDADFRVRLSLAADRIEEELKKAEKARAAAAEQARQAKLEKERLDRERRRQREEEKRARKARKAARRAGYDRPRRGKK